MQNLISFQFVQGRGQVPTSSFVAAASFHDGPAGVATSAVASEENVLWSRGFAGRNQLTQALI